MPLLSRRSYSHRRPPNKVCAGYFVPVRPRTRVTLTSLTGALAVSMMCDLGFDGDRSCGVDLAGLRGRTEVVAVDEALLEFAFGARNSRDS